MKRIFALASAAFLLVACNNETETTVERTDSTSMTDNTTMTDNTSSNAYAAGEGDVTYRENKVRVMRNGQWVDADDDVRLDNGVIIYRDGRTERDGKTIRLEDGQIVTKTGNFFDKTGKAIENAWDDTKEGVKKAGKEIKDAVDGNDNN